MENNPPRVVSLGVIMKSSGIIRQVVLYFSWHVYGTLYIPQHLLGGSVFYNV